MPAGFYTLKIDKIIRETPDAVSIRLLVPPPLIERFNYKAGQYLTFFANINGEEVRRSYSVCESPFEDVMPTIAVKRVPGGRMSNYLNDHVKEGDLIEAMPPMGKFFVDPEPARSHQYVLFGGGSGVTPLKSILRTILKEEPNSKVTMVYANRDEESIIFKNELQELSQTHADRFKLIHVLEKGSMGDGHLTGRLNTMSIVGILKNLPENYTNSSYFICGPGPMMETVKQALVQGQVQENRIHIEYFTAVEKDVNEAASKASDEEASDGIITRTVTVSLYGDEEQVVVNPDQTILEAAQDAGMDPPYSCTVGVCTTCRARVEQGKVIMDEREGLSDAEIEEGFVLTCQAHPCSENVKVSFE
jgi:ring-1,2-phenylacetyl-CoA epoxidase subunit PaaE